jgi:hypothetical protein
MLYLGNPAFNFLSPLLLLFLCSIQAVLPEWQDTASGARRYLGNPAFTALIPVAALVYLLTHAGSSS